MTDIDHNNKPAMHDNEMEIDASLVKRLITEQFPHWADLPIKLIDSSGTDNAIYRLGEDMAVRIPRIESATGQVEKEQQWLPFLAPHLPIPIPILLGLGMPSENYPWRWSVYRWLEGENATIEQIADQQQAAFAMAGFITALQRINTDGGPAPGQHNSGRGVPLAIRDTPVRQAISKLYNVIDTDAATKAWEAALHTPVWQGKPVWIHGDLHAGNLLVKKGKISAIIDFGCLGVGDPACDLMVAWNLFSSEAREVFRAALSIDDATWARGRGWALSIGLIALPYYMNTNPVLTGIAHHLIDEVLIDHKRNS